MEIGQSTWIHQAIVLSERDGSEKEIFLTQTIYPDGIFMSIIGRVTLQTRMFAVRRWKCCKSNATGVTNFPFEGHCAVTNSDGANEVQENVVTAKKGKKRGIKAITSVQVNNPYL